MITSTSNEQIKAIRKLKERKNRNESGSFYIEGIRIVLEALEKPERVQTIFSRLSCWRVRWLKKQ
jgi:TrmH family RNA methyltransferase